MHRSVWMTCSRGLCGSRRLSVSGQYGRGSASANAARWALVGGSVGQGDVKSGGHPAPAVVVLAGDRLAVAGNAAGAVVVVAAVLAGFVAVAAVRERVACGGSCRGRVDRRW